MGGYICGSKDAISFLKKSSTASSYHTSMAPVVCQQVLSSFHIIMGKDGTNIGKKKLTQLQENSNYLRTKLDEMGLHTLGDYDSPIIPFLIYAPSKVACFSRLCLDKGLAVVVVGFPATSIILSRARICLSSSLTREDLDHAIDIISEVADILCLKFSKNMLGTTRV